jgi:tyrosyl-tRNA synthetase
VDAGVVADLEWRGMVHQRTDPGLGARMAAERFTAYHGIDVTADSLHVGHLVGVIALQRLQRAGHRPLAVLGGATTLVGDPSGRETERPLLTIDEIEANARGIRGQLESFLEFGVDAHAARLLNNADWLSPLRLTDFLRDVGKHFTVNTMIAKESVRARLEGREQGISYTEFSYMLLQAYDFLHLFDTEACRLQVGGSDQWGNITAGIELVRRVRGAGVYGLTWPLLTRADGSKFGKSTAGNVWLDPSRTSPYAFFQYWVNTDDRDVGRFLRLFTFLGPEQVQALEAAVAERPGAREAQRALAEELTTAVHGRAEAARARRAAAALFAGDVTRLDPATMLEVLAEAPSTDLPRSALDGAGLELVDVLVRAGLAPSRSAARTAVSQGGVYVNDRRETDTERRLGAADLVADACIVLRKGKRSYHLLRFA